MQSTVFTVEGRYPFPLDMLRYDQAYPYNVDDVAEIEASMNRERGEDGKRREFTVRLVSACQSSPTVERWRSFGWGVTQSH